MSGLGSTAVRLALVVAAGAAIVAIISWQRTEDDCNEAAAVIGRGLAGSAGRAEMADARATLLGDCHGSAPLLSAAGALQGAGRSREAERLARHAVREEPDNYGAWATLWIVLAERAPAAARRARARALELNPLAAR